MSRTLDKLDAWGEQVDALLAPALDLEALMWQALADATPEPCALVVTPERAELVAVGRFSTGEVVL